MRVRLLLLLGLLVTGLDDARAMRCDDGSLTETGDRRFEVRRACGEPDLVDRYPEAYVAGVGFVGVIEQWYYNPGPRQLLRILTFREGRLVREDTGGHGFSTFPRGNCSPREIRRGMSKFELLVRCGEPDYREAFFQPGGSWVHGRSNRLASPRIVDEWTYNFGSGRFLRHVRLMDGRVESVSVGDRGY